MKRSLLGVESDSEEGIEVLGRWERYDEEMKGNYFDLDCCKNSKITRSMRAILINWMGEVADHFFMSRKTVHYAASYLDKYMRVRHLKVDRQQF